MVFEKLNPNKFANLYPGKELMGSLHWIFFDQWPAGTDKLFAPDIVDVELRRSRLIYPIGRWYCFLVSQYQIFYTIL